MKNENTMLRNSQNIGIRDNVPPKKTEIHLRNSLLKLLVMTKSGNFLLALILTFATSYSIAATRTASVSGSWSNTATWGGLSVPGAGDDVIINDNRNVTIDIANANCQSITINGGGNASFITVGANNLTVVGAINIQSPTANNTNKYITISSGSLTCSSITMNNTTADSRDCYITIGTGTVNVSGSITMAATAARHHIDFTGAGSLYIQGDLIEGGLSQTAGNGSNVYFNGSNAQTIQPNAANGYSFYNLYFQTSGIKTLGQSVTVNRNLSINGTAVLNCQQFNITGNAAGTMTMDSGTELILGSPSSVTNTLFPSNYTNPNISLNILSTVTYSADINQTISGIPTYGKLNILAGNTSGRTRTINANTIVNGDLIISGVGASTTSFLPAGFNLTVNGTTNINAFGTFNDNNTAGSNIFVGLVNIAADGVMTNTNNPTFEFQGGITNNGTFTKAGTGTISFTFNNQTISGSNALTISGGDFIISNPASLTVSNDISFSGTNLIVNSNNLIALNQTSGTFTFALNAAQNITGSGSGSISFNNLTSVSSAKTANLPFTVTNVFNVLVSTFSLTGGTYNFGTANITGVLNLGSIPNIVNITGDVALGTLNFGTGAPKIVNIGGNLSSGNIITANDGLFHQLNLSGTTNTLGNFTTTGSNIIVNYNRAGDQQIATSANYRNLIISGGGTKTLSGNATINSNLDLQAGNIALTNYNLVLGAGATLTNTNGGTFGNTNMIVTDGTGYFQNTATGSTPSEFVMVYPVGTGTSYTPFEITSCSATTFPANSYIRVRAVAGTAGLAPVVNPTDLNKYWVTQTSAIIGLNANISFTYVDPNEVRGDQTKYALQYSNGTTWATPASPSPDGANPLSSIGTTNLGSGADLFWTARENRKTLYSYQTGDWKDASTWTTDPSGSLWQGASVPGDGDRAVVLNGRTVTVTLNNYSVYSTTVNQGGILELGNTSGHNFGSISGQGLIRLKSANMPGGTYTNFVASGGGTVEYYDLNNTLISSNQLVYNNLIISNSTGNNNSIYLNNNVNPKNYTINGDFTLNNSGTGTLTFAFGNPTASDNLINLTVYGNLTVGSGCNLRVNNFATAHAIPNANDNTTPYPVHTLNLYGDFTNNGSVRFTGLPSPVTNAYYTLASTATGGTNYGDVQVYFRGATNNTVNCNGVTDFYRIVLEKGTDQTYILEVNSTDPNNFALYGPNYQGNNAFNGGPEGYGYGAYYKALFVRYGTLKLNDNISLPSLSEGGQDFNIIPTACLWMDGAIVSTTITGVNGTGYQAATLYGKLRISAGSFSTGDAAGIVLGTLGSPVIQIEETGTLDVSQAWAAVGGGNIITYLQTGGTANIRLQGENHAGPMLGLNDPDNVFIMTGGTLNFTDVLFAGGGTCLQIMDLQSSSNNYQVGGDAVVNFNLPGNYTYTVNTTVPFNNLNINRRTGTNNVTIQCLNTSSTEVVVNKNLSINANGILDLATNNLSLTVGGDFTLNTNSTYTPSQNIARTTTFNGSGPQSFTVSGTINGNLRNLSLINSSDLTLYGNNLTVLGNFNINSGCILRDNGRTVTVQGNINNSGTHFRPVSGTGSIILTGTNAQTIDGDGNGIFNNLTLNKTGGSVATNAKFTITGELRLANTAALLNIGSNNLYFTSTADIFDNTTGTGKVFNNTKMILTRGLSSDNGITREFNSISSYLFPFGITVGATNYYTPATIQYSSAPTAYGNVTSRPVNGRHSLATGAANAITCYWKTSSSGFSGIPASSVHHLYYYDFAGSNTFVAGTEANYVPGVLLNGTTWSYINNTALVNDGTNEINFNTANAADGEFLAGSPAAFGAIPTLYSSSTPGAWNNAASWSSTGVGGAGGAGTPTASTIVIIGDGTHNHTINVTANTAVCGSLFINTGSTLDLSTFTGHNFAGIPDKGVAGSGTLRIASSTFPSGDFGSFIGPNGGTVEYYTSNASITIPNTSASGLNLTSYKNLKLTHSVAYTITMPNQNITIYGDMTIAATGTPTGTVRLNTAAATRTVTVNGNLNINSGTFEFRTPVQILKILGNVNLNGGIFQVQNNAAVTHTLEIWGNLNASSTFNMSNGTGYVNTYFKGTNNTSISGSAGTIDFYKLYVDKGTNSTPVLSLETPITVTPATGQLVYLLNGTFRINNSSLTLSVSAANTNFDIPPTACLSVQDGTCRVAYNSGGGAGAAYLTLNGKLEVLGGTMAIGNINDNTANDIEYSAGGAPAIDVQGGQLIVAGQVRRNTVTTSGALNLSMSNNGAFTIYGNNAIATRAKLEILNSGSSFTMMGGTITIIKSGGTTYGDLYLNPETYSVSNGTIEIGNNASTAGQTFNLFAACPLNHLKIGTSSNSQTALLNVYNLNLLGDLTIFGSSEFRANSLDVIIKGNLNNFNPGSLSGLNSGGFQAGSASQTTTFNGAGQTITGSGSNITNFANLNISSTGTVDLAANTTLRVNNNMYLNSGTLASGSNSINLIGNIYNKAIHTSSTTSGGIVFYGTTNQTLSGNGVFGNVVINNANDVFMLDNTRINGQLNIINGRLYIDDYELTLGPSATTIGSFGTNRMILLNGALSDKGVKKMFNSGVSAAITLPIGVAGKYTPAVYTVHAASSAGTITVRPVSGAHPALSDAIANNNISYYWSIDSTGFGSGMSITSQYTYNNADAGTEVNYVVGKYNYKQYTWTNLGNVSPYTVTTGSNLIKLSTATFVTGDITAGAATNFVNVVPLYSRNSRPTNNWFDAASWTTNPDGSDCSDANCIAGHANNYPMGNPVIIRPGHSITLNNNSATSVSIEINGELNCGTTVYHSLGKVFGTGKIILTSSAAGMFVFPGGSFDEFLDTPNTTLEFTGNNTATLPLKPGNIYKPYQNVIFSGTGRKDISSENLKIVGNLTIQSDASLYNATYNKDIYILGNWTDNNTSANGGYIPGTGNVYFNGTTAQTLTVADGTSTEQFYNLTINNSAGITLAGGGKVQVSKYLYLTAGNITTSSTNLLRLSNTSTAAIIGGGQNSYVNGPLSKNILSGQSFTYPIGNGSRFGRFVLNNTSVAPSPQYWTATYYNSNPNPTYPTLAANLNSPISDISNNEYWVVNRPSGGSANVTLRWDASSYPAVTGNAALRTKLRVVEFELATSKWTQRGNTISGNAAAGTVSTTTPVSNNDFVFTLGLIGVTAGIITPPATYSICDNGAQASIQVALSGTPPWTLNYQTSGNSIVKNFNQTGINSTPFTIQLNATDLGGYGTNPYTLSLNSIADASTTGVVNNTTIDITVKQSYTPSITGSSFAGLNEIRSYSTTNHPGSTYLWQWNGASGGTIATPANSTTNITFTPIGSYNLQITETYTGCANTVTLPITVSNIPTPDINQKTANICIGTTQAYSTANNAGNEYRWTVTNGICTGCSGTFSSAVNANSISVNWTTAGNAVVTVEERKIATPLAIGTATQNYYVSPMPVNQTISGNTICEGNTGTITLANSENGVTYQLRLNSDSSNVGVPVNGAGSTITLPTSALTTSTNFNVLATNEGCQLQIPTAPAFATITVNSLPTITLGTNPTVCLGSTSANLNYTATTYAPDQYSIVYSAAANTAGFINVTNVALPASPIVLSIPVTATTTTYTGILTVRNSVTGCISGDYPISITINPYPNAITGTTTLCIGSTTTLGNSTPGGSWASGNTSIATVDGSGVVTGISVGTCAINYTLGGCTVTTNVTVSAATVNPSLNVATPASGTSICASYNGPSATINAGSGGAAGAADLYEYSLNNGGSWNSYTAGNTINTTGATTNVLLRVSRSAGSTGCLSTGPTTIVSWPISNSPIAPTLSAASPTNGSTICAGFNTGTVTGVAGSGGSTGATDEYQVSINGGTTYAAYTSGNAITTTGATGTVIVQSRRTGGSYGCSNTAWNTISTWAVGSAPDAPTLSVASPVDGSSICVGFNTGTVTGASGSGGSTGAGDEYQLSINGGTTYVAYTSGAAINTVGATGSIIVQARRTGGSYGCSTTAWSTLATWTVNASPSITADPSNSTIFASQNTSFTVGASGTGLSYQWEINTGSGWSTLPNGGVYSNVTTATMNITAAILSMNSYQYRCVVTGTCTPSATSNAAVLYVNPTATASIAGTTSICNGQSASLIVTLLTGNSSNWGFKYSDGTTTYTIPLGLTTSPYTLTLSPGSTTTYTLTEVSDNNGVGTIVAPTNAVITVNPNPSSGPLYRMPNQ